MEYGDNRSWDACNRLYWHLYNAATTTEATGRSWKERTRAFFFFVRTLSVSITHIFASQLNDRVSFSCTQHGHDDRSDASCAVSSCFLPLRGHLFPTLLGALWLLHSQRGAVSLQEWPRRTWARKIVAVEEALYVFTEYGSFLQSGDHDGSDGKVVGGTYPTWSGRSKFALRQGGVVLRSRLLTSICLYRLEGTRRPPSAFPKSASPGV